MPSEPIQMRWPMKGLSDNVSFAGQEPDTTREGKNVRGLDPVTGRERGGQRSGLSKYNDNLISGANPIRDLNYAVVDNRKLEYDALAAGSVVTDFETQVPSNKESQNVKVDRQGNIYALDGTTGVVKYNPSGTQLWRISPTTGDDKDVIRALHVDAIDTVYVAVSSGTVQGTARMWAYRQLPDNETEQLWEVEVGGWIQDIKTRQDKLYIVADFDDRRESECIVYNSIDSAAPQEAQRWKAAWKVTALDIGPDGSIFVGHAIFPFTISPVWRPGVPGVHSSVDSLDYSAKSEDWTYLDLDEADNRVWSFYDSENIDGLNNSTLEDGDEVTFWHDSSGNGRHLTGSVGSGPTFTATGGINGTPGLVFAGAEELSSQAATSVDPSQADQQRTGIPMYNDSVTPNNSAAWAVFCLFRPEAETSATQRAVWAAGTAGSTAHAVIINSTTVPAADDATVRWYYNGDGGGLTGADGTGTRPLESTQADGGGRSTVTGACMTTCVNSNGITGGTDQTNFRAKGVPMDTFTSTRAATGTAATDNFRVGAALDATFVAYRGLISDILVLDRKNRTVTSGDHVLSVENRDYSDTSNQADDECTKLEGWLMHRKGIARDMPEIPGVLSTHTHPYGSEAATPRVGPPDSGRSGAYGQALYVEAGVSKFSAAGDLLWFANTNATGDGTNPGGFGYGVAVNSDGNVYTTGRDSVPGSGAHDFRMIVDEGDTFSIDSADGAWSVTLSSIEFDFDYPQLAVDKFDNLYIPYNDSAAGSSLLVYDKDGTELLDYTHTNSEQAYAVAVDPNIPDYRSTDPIDSDGYRAEFVVLATDGNGSPSTTSVIHRLNLISTANATGSVRSTTLVAVVDGDVTTFVSGATAPATPTNGSNALDSTSETVFSTTIFNEVFYTDGRNYKAFDPVKDTVSDWESTSAGQIPQRAKLIENWRGRIVLARTIEDPQNWHMSEAGDPRNWDLFPPVLNSIQAVSGNSPVTAGRVPDIVNAIVPYNDDILVFLCDHSCYYLHGDPMAGGQIDLISDIVGGSFGRPWTKDPHGRLYFFGSRGGVFMLVPGQAPQRITRDRIERRMADIDLSSFHIRLAWNYREEGLHVFQIPFGSTGSIVAHWFWDQKTDAWWEDEINLAATNPGAVLTIDGDDPDDRKLLLGGMDGYVRVWDESAKDDDGTAINANVLFGPYSTHSSDREMIFKQFTAVLADDRDGAFYQLYANDRADVLPLANLSGSLTQGRNPAKFDAMRGAYCWLRIGNGMVGQSWAFEEAFIKASPGGRTRVRT